MAKANVALAYVDGASIVIDLLKEDDVVEIKTMVGEWTDGITTLAPLEKQDRNPVWKIKYNYWEIEKKLDWPTKEFFLGGGSKTPMYYLGYGNKLYKGKKRKAPIVTLTMIEQSTGKQKKITKSVNDFCKFVKDNVIVIKKIDVSRVQAYLSISVSKNSGSFYTSYLAKTLVKYDFSVNEGIYTKTNETEDAIIVDHSIGWHNSQRRGFLLGDISLNIYY